MVSISKTFLDFKYRSFKEQLKYPLRHQSEVLKEICEQLALTRYATELGIIGTLSPEEYRACVPISRYKDISAYIYQIKLGDRDVLQKDRIKYYGESSGTTGRNKTIPLSKKYVRDGLIKGSVYSAAIVNHYKREATDGHTILLPGSLKQQADYYVGDVSAVMSHRIPFFLKSMSAARYDVEVETRWEEKLEAIWETSLGTSIKGMCGLPTWNVKMLEYFRATKSPRAYRDFIADLSFFVHGGINIQPYKDHIQDLIEQKDLLYVDVYNATEGFFACQDDPTDDSMSLILDGSVYYEFVEVHEIDKENPSILSLSEVEVGKKYVLVISNTSGLYRYVMEDIVTFTEVRPYKLRIQGRTSGFLNTFGEEVMEENCNQVITMISKELGIHLSDYTIAPLHISAGQGGSLGCHYWVLESQSELDIDTDLLTRRIDQLLQELNHDYTEKRKNDAVLSRPEVAVVPPGTFHRYLTTREKVSVQSKVPRIVHDLSVIRKILGPEAVLTT